MTSLFSNARLSAYRGIKRLGEFSRNASAQVHPCPLFVFGNQKSGTSVIAALIAANADLNVTIDFQPEVRFPTVPDVVSGHKTMRSFISRNRLGFSRPVIKEPALTFMAERILERWPSSKYVFVLRNPFENIRSILDRLQLPGDLETLDSANTSAVSLTWGTVLDNRWLGITAEHYIEQLAYRWVYATECYKRFSDRFTLIRYEDFEGEKIKAIHDLVECVGLQPVASIDHLVDVQYQPAGRRGRTPQEVYGENLERLVDICWPLAQEFGYEKPDCGRSV